MILGGNLASAFKMHNITWRAAPLGLAVTAFLVAVALAVFIREPKKGRFIVQVGVASSLYLQHASAPGRDCLPGGSRPCCVHQGAREGPLHRPVGRSSLINTRSVHRGLAVMALAVTVARSWLSWPDAHPCKAFCCREPCSTQEAAQPARRSACRCLTGA